MPKAFAEFGYEMIAQKVECKAIARKGVTIIREVRNVDSIGFLPNELNCCTQTHSMENCRLRFSSQFNTDSLTLHGN